MDKGVQQAVAHEVIQTPQPLRLPAREIQPGHLEVLRANSAREGGVRTQPITAGGERAGNIPATVRKIPPRFRKQTEDEMSNLRRIQRTLRWSRFLRRTASIR